MGRGGAGPAALRCPCVAPRQCAAIRNVEAWLCTAVCRGAQPPRRLLLALRRSAGGSLRAAPPLPLPRGRPWRRRSSFRSRPPQRSVSPQGWAQTRLQRCQLSSTSVCGAGVALDAGPRVLRNPLRTTLRTAVFRAFPAKSILGISVRLKMEAVVDSP